MHPTLHSTLCQQVLPTQAASRAADAQPHQNLPIPFHTTHPTPQPSSPLDEPHRESKAHILLEIRIHAAPPSSASWGSSPPSVGFQLDLEDPQMGGIWGRGDPCLYPCAALPPPFPARLRRLQALPRSKQSRWHAQHLRLRFPAAIAELLLSRAEAGGGETFFFFLNIFSLGILIKKKKTTEKQARV